MNEQIKSALFRAAIPFAIVSLGAWQTYLLNGASARESLAVTVGALILALTRVSEGGYDGWRAKNDKIQPSDVGYKK